MGENKNKTAKANGKLSRAELKRKLNSRNFKYGSYATIIIAVVVAISVVINIGVVMLVSLFPSLKLDMTSDKRYQVTEDLMEIVMELERETEIILCADKETFEKNYNTVLGAAAGGDAIYEGTRVVEMLTKADEASDKLKVSFVDLERNPALVAKYGGELNPTDVIIVSEIRSRVVHVEDMYLASTNETTGETNYTSYFDFEIANSIVNVNATEVPLVAFTTGHGEAVPAYLKDLLEDNCFETTEINLMTSPEFPQEAEVIVICAPKSDFSRELLKKLDEFLENGGKRDRNVVFMLSPEMKEVTNINEFMREWGFEIQESGSYVVESDPDKYISNKMYPIAQYNGDDIFAKYSNYTTITYQTVPLKTLWGAGEDHSEIAMNIPLQTSDSCYAIPAGSDSSYVPSKDEKGSFPLVAYAGTGETAQETSYVGVVTSYEMFNGYTSVDGAGNADVALHFFQRLTDTVGNNYSAFVRAIQFTKTDITITASQATTIGIVLFSIIVPLAVLSCGFVMWLRRRHL